MRLKLQKIPNITGLRFYLALCVLLFHTSQFCAKHNIPFYNDLPIFNKGFEAVCAFFSLSGFLIIRQLYVEKHTNKSISLKNFYLRRSLRIFPLYFLIVTYGFIHYNYLLPKFGFVGNYNTDYDLVEAIVLVVFFMPNVFSSLYHPGGIVEVLWSLGVEEQFYLFIAPMLLIVPVKKYVYFLILSTIIFFYLYFYLESNFLPRFGMLFFYFTSSGIVSILLVEHKNIFRNKLFEYGLLFLFVLFFTTDVFVSNFSLSHYYFFSMLLYSGAIGVLSSKSYAFLNNTITTYLGKISYGIYVYHSVVIQFLGLIFVKFIVQIELNNTIVIVFYNVFVIVLTVLTSHLSYQYFEKYFINLYPLKNLERKNFF